MDRRAEHVANQHGEHRIAHPPVEERHGIRFDPASARGQPAALHQVIRLPQSYHEFLYLAKIVAVVCVSHDYEFAVRARNSRLERAAVTFLFDTDNTRPMLL